MASEQDAMLAMMAQMQGAGGNAMPNSMPPNGMPNSMSNGMSGGMPTNYAPPARHKKRQSNLSLSLMEIQAKQMVDPITEIEEYRNEKDLLLEAYDKIDLDDNGDIEFDEFNQGMRTLNVSLSEEEILQVFNLMDSDASNFIDRNEFTMFLTQRFESRDLNRFQDAILKKLGGRARADREMRAAMNAMVNEETQILKEEDKLYAEMQAMEEEKDNFCDVENAENWDRYEVANWMETEVKLSEYMVAFMKAGVDGSMLLSDLGSDQLTMDLGVKRVHVQKIMRAIIELRDKLRKEWDESDCFDVIPTNMMIGERAMDKIAYLEQTLNEKDAEMTELKKDYEARIEKLIAELSEKEKIIKQAETDGFLFGNDGNGGTDDENGSDMSDSADVDMEMTDEEMPPLIDAHQHTIAYFADDQQQNEKRESVIVEEIPQQTATTTTTTTTDENKEDKDESYEIVEVSPTNNNNDNDNEDKPQNDDEKENDEPRNTTLTPAVSAPSVDVVDKVLSVPNSPNLTPSASQTRFEDQQSKSKNKRKRHHRKNSTKTGFWAQAKGGKRPPNGTKAYWLYLDQKHDMNANFAYAKRVLQWQHHEIAYWLKSIKCDKYAMAFLDERVSGEQLCMDMNSTVLSSDLGVKMLHCGKIMREIEKLKIEAGITFGIEEKINDFSIVPKDDESISKQMERIKEEMKEIDHLHEEELKKNEEKYDELQQECEKLKVEIENLEKQNIALEKRKNRVIDEDDTDFEDEEEDENGQNNDEQKENEENMEEQDILTPSKRPKGYFRKYPKEIRKLMREIDEMNKKSQTGAFGANNVGKFGAKNRAFKWKVHEVCHWLETQGFVNYIHSFYKNEIDGEILVNDLSANILHEDLNVKRFHTGKILREIRNLRKGGNYTLDDNVIDVEYVAKFSASQQIESLSKEKENLQKQMQELIDRPQIEESQKIVEIQAWDDLVSENQRLAEQVDVYEDKITNIKDTMVPVKELAEKQEERRKFVLELERMKKEQDKFGDVVRVREWSNNEVCWYFASIGLSVYIDGIKEQMINGEILIEDSSPEMLSKDIGVKRIHINQILRSIEDLKHKAFGYEEDENVNDFEFVPEMYATQRNEKYEADILNLQNEIKKMGESYNELMEKYNSLSANHENLNNEKQALLANIDGLNQSIIDLKNQQKLDMEDAVKQSVQSLEDEIKKLKQTIAENEEKYKQENEEKEAKNNEILSQKDEEMNGLNKQIEELNENLLNAQDQISEFEEEKRLQREEEEAKDNSYQAQLRRKARDDATFCVPKRAHNWTIEEVSHWLFTIKIPDYVDKFKEQIVDGSMLLSDLSAEQLRTDLSIKPQHIGRITREIAKLKELALPPLEESEDFLCESSYIPQKPATEIIEELKNELNGQNDINSALKMEVTQLQNQYETIKEIQAMGASMQLNEKETAGGPNANAQNQENDDLVESKEQNDDITDDIDIEQVSKLSEENKELLQLLEYAQQSKMDLAMRTAEEMQKLRSMLRVASKAYEEVTGTPFGQVAQWPSTQNFFYNTLGMGQTPKNDYHHQNDHNHHYR